MRILVVILTIFGLFVNEKAESFKHTNPLEIILVNDPNLPSLGSGPERFWRARNHKLFDTVLIKSERLVSIFDKEVSRLSEDQILIGFHCEISFIRNRASGSDTFYSDRSLKYWFNGGKYFVDTSSEQRLNKMFGNFFLFN